jgi:hypothetical protein
MPFINPPDVLPEAMRFIVRLLLQAEEPVLQAEVVRRISPAGLAEVTSGTPLDEKPKLGPAGRYIVEATLTAMRGAGLVEVSGSDREIGLTPLVSEHFSKWEEVDAETFAQFLLEQVVAVASDVFEGSDEDEAKTGGAEDLAHTISLLLQMPNPMDPISGFESGGGKTLQAFQGEQFGLNPKKAGWFVPNSEQYLNVARWVSYLGFGYFDGSRGLLIEPSAVLKEPVQNVLGKTDMPLEHFLGGLGSQIPITDRGAVASAVVNRLKNPQPKDQLSPGLAFGLRVLHEQKVIKLDSQADATSFGFPLREGSKERYTHIALGGKP